MTRTMIAPHPSPMHPLRAVMPARRS